MLDEGDLSLNHQVQVDGHWTSLEDYAADAGWLGKTRHEPRSAPPPVEQESEVGEPAFQNFAPPTSPPSPSPPRPTPPIPIQQKIHIASTDGTPHIYDESQVRGMMSQGLLRGDALYWREGMADWKPLRNLGLGGPGPRPNPVAPHHSTPGAGENHSPNNFQQEQPGLGRLIYFLSLLGANLLAAVFTAEAKGDPGSSIILGLLFLIANIVLAVFRLQNIGKSGWWSLLLLVPLANLYIGILCLFAPPNYEKTHTLDIPAKVIIGLILGMLGLFILALFLAALAR